jgi:hypothetical protein
MKSNTLLDCIWQTYEVTCDCLKVAQRSVSKKDLRLLNKTKFITISEEQAGDWISKSRKDSDDYIILSLWAIFERIMIECLQEQGKKILDHLPSDFNKKVYDKIESEIEYWRIDDILDIFKGTIDSHLIGHVKQIKAYRDWIAHRNIKKVPPSNVLPQTAYKVLSEILAELKDNSEFDFRGNDEKCECRDIV